jgi:cytochrome c oxidase accessory protein FixG
MPNLLKAKKPTKELPLDRLATTTESGQRVYLYPAFFKGKFKSARTLVYTLLLVVFLGLPWVKINHHSAVLLDIVHRKFSLFGLTFWGHDAPILFLVLALFILTLGLITSVLGRVWCGWMCPQTVFIDVIFRKIEAWIEGSPNDRIKLDQSPLTFHKGVKRSVKWSLYILASFVITHSFLAYFTGTETLKHIVTHPPSQHPTAMAAMIIANAIILFNFGWFREQFCIIACPYGRFQSVFMDPNSLVVGYDKNRDSDCIDCHRCVAVCPTGVDIRRGVQLECIMCTACIDACDAVMTKIQKPKGLVKYTTENALSGLKTQWLRVRVFVYIVLLVGLGATLAWVVSHREWVPIFIRTSQASPYFVLPNGHVVNPVTIRIHNQHFEPIQIQVNLNPSDHNAAKIRWITPTPRLTVGAGENAVMTVMVEFPQDILQNGTALLSVIKTTQHPHHGTQTHTEEMTLVGPLL